MRNEPAQARDACRSIFTLKDDGAPLAVLLAIAAVYFLPVLLRGNRQVLSSIDGDTWSQFFYWRHFAFGSLAKGELPLWNPYNFSGTPFVATMQSAIFYPLNWLFLLFDTPFAINLSVALHCLGASVFTYFLARYLGISSLGAVLSAVTFTYGAPYFIHIYPGHLPHLAAMWMPLMFLAMEAFLRHRRMRDAVWAGVCLAMEILAGYPQYPFYSALALAAYFLIHLILRKQRDGLPALLGGWVLFVITAAALSAIQLVPAWELVRNSARGDVSYEWISIFSLPPENLLTLVVPNLFGDIVNVPYWGKNNLWEMSIYLGIVPLAMIALAVVLNRSRQVIVFGVIAAIFLLLALGKHTPFLWILYTFVPGFDLFRGVGKAAFIFAFAGALLAGFGFDILRQLVKKADKRLHYVASFLMAAVVLIPVVAFVSSAGDVYSWNSFVRAYAAGEEHFDALPMNRQFFAASLTIFWSDVAKLLIILLSLAALCFFARSRRWRSPKKIGIAIVALALADLWHFGSRYVVTFDPQILALDQDLRAFFKAETKPFRIATPLGHLRNHLLNIGMLEGVENVGGYDAIVLKNYSEFINFTQGLTIDEPNLLMGINRISPLLNLLNVKYYVVEPAININLPDFEIAFQNTRNKVYRSRKALPRSFVVHSAVVANGVNEVLGRMADPGFDPAKAVILEKPPTGLHEKIDAQSPLPEVLEHALTRVVIAAQSDTPGFLVLADAYYPGWKAFMDGKESPIYRANFVMRAVFLPPGRHTVVFRYDPVSFKLGAAISAGALLLMMGFVMVAAVRKSGFLQCRINPNPTKVADREQ
ncbi:MAG: YfhO family protein [Alphaproteobacteria bacterium]